MHNDQKMRKRARFWLYGPIVLVALIAVAWSVGWFVLRGKAESIIDTELAREAGRGRVLTCADRSIGGFPFRFEVNCANLTYAQGRISANLGPTTAVVQAYNPRHVIVEAAGPLQFSNGVVSVAGAWKAMEASISGIGRDGFERISLVTKGSSFTVSDTRQPGIFAFSAQSTGLHIRPMAGTAIQDRSFDIALDAQGVAQPELDLWTSDKEPLQIDAALSLTKVPLPFSPDPLVSLENWRQAGGVLTITKFDNRKGGRILNLNGTFKIDDAHKPETTFKVVQANFSELLKRAMTGGDLGAKFQQPLTPVSPDASKATQVAIPVQIINGEVRVAGFKTPAKVQPLY